MPIAFSSSGTFIAKPISAGGIELLATISAISFVLGAAALLCIVIAASIVAFKTRMPVRRSILVSLLLVPGWWGFEQYLGGSLEMTFGPQAISVAAIVYAIIAFTFAAGYMRMCLGFMKQRSTSSHHG
jgi:hypothetical protein